MRAAQLSDLLSDPRPAIVVLIVALLTGIVLGSALDSGGGTKVVTEDARIGPNATTSVRSAASRSAARHVSHQSPTGAAPDQGVLSAWQTRLQNALNRGVQEAEGYGGKAAGAVWVQGWASPIAAGVANLHDRMWSISKPVTAIAVLEAAEKLGVNPSAGTRQAMKDAITRSDNCAQRRVELALEDLTRSNGLAEYRGVLARAGVSPTHDVEILPLEASDDQDCLPYLNETGASDPTGDAPQLGTFFWTVDDAVKFAYALAKGTYGAAGARVLELMRLPKEHALQATWRQDYTAPLDTPPSGGDFRAGWEPGYKGGWGGSTDGDFSASQIIVLNVAGHVVAIAGRFWPYHQPTSDNPGDTAAPRALGALFAALEHALTQLAPTT